jgi:chromosome segregation ATPase
MASVSAATNNMWKERYDILAEELACLKEIMEERECEEAENRAAKRVKVENPNTDAAVTTTATTPPAAGLEIENSKLRLQVNELERQSRSWVRDRTALTDKISALTAAASSSDANRRKVDDLTQELSAIKQQKEEVVLLQKLWTSWRKDVLDIVAALEEAVGVHSKRVQVGTSSHPPELARILDLLKTTKSKFVKKTLDFGALEREKDKLVAELAEAAKMVSTQQLSNGELERKVKTLEDGISTHRGRIRALENENSSLTELMESYEGSAAAAEVSPTVAALKTNITRLTAELSTATENNAALTAKYDTTVNKFYKLKDALMSEKDKAARAEARAIDAENLAGKGSYNSSETRVLHLAQNPRQVAMQAQFDRELAAERERADALEAQLNSSVDVSSSNASAYNITTPAKTPARTTPSKGTVIDYEKVNIRLKQQFTKTTAMFRDSVRQLFGYKVDMEGLEKGRAQFKLRSMFAEKEEDCLVFKQNAEGKLDLCETEFAKTLGPEHTMYLTTAKSVPSFLSNVTLTLFDQQTFLG